MYILYIFAWIVRKKSNNNYKGEISMYQDEFKKASHEHSEAIKMLTEAGESDEVKELVTKLYYKPVQTLALRYEYIKTSRKEGNFEFSKKIANLLAKNFKYSVQDGEDEYLCCVYDGSYAYDFEFILSLARFYQKNQTLFEGHFDIIKRMCESEVYHRPHWEDVKKFWLKHTINH